MWKCLECGRKFRTTRAAERATFNGCPGCGGVDIDDVPDDKEDAITERLKRIFLHRKPKEDKQ